MKGREGLFIVVLVDLLIEPQDQDNSIKSLAITVIESHSRLLLKRENIEEEG